MLKDKRGWTLNSAGYLLGPHAHRPLMDKGALAGKREAAEEPVQLEVEVRWCPLRPPAERGLQTLLDFLSSLCLPELGPWIVCPPQCRWAALAPGPRQSAYARSPPSR
ncbi:galanin peptides-like [Chrysemys picta bellii]|uniref:galanin peptides-like n=1 Tax=Chrysemys picta bellii TaxID=8478 RepID=UPI0032B0FC71